MILIKLQIFIYMLFKIATAAPSNILTDIYEIQSCKCKNDGLCVLDNDFCVCKAEYTGRYCELKLAEANNIAETESAAPTEATTDEDDYVEASFEQGNCGSLLRNGESEYFNCAKCTCQNQVLTCIALANDICQEASLISQKRGGVETDNTREYNLVDMMELKKMNTDLNVLLQHMHYIENFAYDKYINEFRRVSSYENILFKDVELDDQQMNQQAKLDDDQLVIFVSNQDRHVVGLYFNFITDDQRNSATNFLGPKFKVIFSLVIVSLYLKLKF